MVGDNLLRVELLAASSSCTRDKNTVSMRVVDKQYKILFEHDAGIFSIHSPYFIFILVIFYLKIALPLLSCNYLIIILNGYS